MFNQLLTTIMKKNLWMLAAALCMTACSQNEDIVIEQPVSDNAGRTANHPIGWNRDTYRSQRRRNTRTAG